MSWWQAGCVPQGPCRAVLYDGDRHLPLAGKGIRFLPQKLVQVRNRYWNTTMPKSHTDHHTTHKFQVHSEKLSSNHSCKLNIFHSYWLLWNLQGNGGFKKKLACLSKLLCIVCMDSCKPKLRLSLTEQKVAHSNCLYSPDINTQLKQLILIAFNFDK